MTPAELRRHLGVCGWRVVCGPRAWVCSAPALHDHEHRLLLGPQGRIAARSWGFTHPEVPTRHQAGP